MTITDRLNKIDDNFLCCEPCECHLKILSLVAALRKAVEALEFYGNSDNYSGCDGDGLQTVDNSKVGIEREDIAELALTDIAAILEVKK